MIIQRSELINYLMSRNVRKSRTTPIERLCVDCGERPSYNREGLCVCCQREMKRKETLDLECSLLSESVLFNFDGSF